MDNTLKRYVASQRSEVRAATAGLTAHDLSGFKLMRFEVVPQSVILNIAQGLSF